MKIDLTRYTSGRTALEDLDASIERLEHSRLEGARPEDLVRLSEQLHLRGDVLGRDADHQRAATIAAEVGALFPGHRDAIVLQAQVATRARRFEEAHALLDRAMVVDRANRQVMDARAALLQATGKFWEALELRDRLAREDRNLQTLGALATLSAEAGQWAMAEMLYADALRADDGISPLPCARLLFEWGMGAMRNGAVDRARELFAHLEALLLGHVTPA
jgi:tetratricopeptide (TPR) repeat protein